MSVLDELDRANVEIMFFDHITKCPDCSKVHPYGLPDLCRAGEQLLEQFKRTMRQEPKVA